MNSLFQNLTFFDTVAGADMSDLKPSTRSDLLSNLEELPLNTVERSFRRHIEVEEYFSFLLKNYDLPESVKNYLIASKESCFRFLNTIQMVEGIADSLIQKIGRHWHELPMTYAVLLIRAKIRSDITSIDYLKEHVFTPKETEKSKIFFPLYDLFKMRGQITPFENTDTLIDTMEVRPIDFFKLKIKVEKMEKKVREVYHAPGMPGCVKSLEKAMAETEKINNEHHSKL